MYDYKPLINVITSGLRTEVDNNIIKTIMDVAVDVDKDELIKALQYDRNQYEKGFSDATPKWIPCDEELPDEGQIVLCSFKNGDIDVWTYRRSILWENPEGVWCNQYIVGITAWMPLPEPYKKEED